MNWIKQALTKSTYRYFVPTDPKQMLYDFYAINLLYQEKHSYRDEELYDIIDQTKKQVAFELRKIFLSDVFFIINCEIRHLERKTAEYGNFAKMYDASSIEDDKRLLNDNSLSLVNAYFKKYHQYIRNFERNPKKIQREGLGNNVQYDISNLAILKTLENNGVSKSAWVRICGELFRYMQWYSQYGGEPWANICEAWLRLSEANNVDDIIIALDHIIDLQHNTGVMFNKMKLWEKDGGYNWLKTLLDHKANIGSPLEIMKYCSNSMQWLLRRALRSLGKNSVLENHDWSREKKYWEDKLNTQIMNLFYVPEEIYNLLGLKFVNDKFYQFINYSGQEEFHRLPDYIFKRITKETWDNVFNYISGLPLDRYWDLRRTLGKEKILKQIESNPLILSGIDPEFLSWIQNDNEFKQKLKNIIFTSNWVYIKTSSFLSYPVYNGVLQNLFSESDVVELYIEYFEKFNNNVLNALTLLLNYDILEYLKTVNFNNFFSKFTIDTYVSVEFLFSELTNIVKIFTDDVIEILTRRCFIEKNRDYLKLALHFSDINDESFAKILFEIYPNITIEEWQKDFGWVSELKYFIYGQISNKLYSKKFEQAKNLSDLKISSNWYKTIKTAISKSTFKYHFPNNDKEKMLSDFYVINSLFQEKSAYRDPELYDLVVEVRKENSFKLKKFLLEDVFFIVCCEIRHLSEHSSFGSYESSYDSDSDSDSDSEVNKEEVYINEDNKHLYKNMGSIFNKYYKIFIKKNQDYDRLYHQYNFKYNNFYSKNKALKDIGSKDSLGNNHEYDISYISVLKLLKNNNMSKESFIRYCLQAFNFYDWEDQYGDIAWANICEAWLRLYNSNSENDIIVAIDHIIDLQHNNGVMFNKIKDWQKNENYSWLKIFLDFKAQMSNPLQLEKQCSSEVRWLTRKVIGSTKAYQNINNKDSLINFWNEQIRQDYKNLFYVPEEVCSKLFKPFLNSSFLQCILYENYLNLPDYIFQNIDKEYMNKIIFPEIFKFPISQFWDLKRTLSKDKIIEYLKLAIFKKDRHSYYLFSDVPDEFIRMFLNDKEFKIEIEELLNSLFSIKASSVIDRKLLKILDDNILLNLIRNNIKTSSTVYNPLDIFQELNEKQIVYIYQSLKDENIDLINFCINNLRFDENNLKILLQLMSFEPERYSEFSNKIYYLSISVNYQNFVNQYFKISLDKRIELTLKHPRFDTMYIEISSIGDSEITNLMLQMFPDRNTIDKNEFINKYYNKTEIKEEQQNG